CRRSSRIRRPRCWYSLEGQKGRDTDRLLEGGVGGRLSSSPCPALRPRRLHLPRPQPGRGPAPPVHQGRRLRREEKEGGGGSLRQASGWGVRGRPRGRSVLSSPSRCAVSCSQPASPNGAPRATDRRSASNSASVCTPLTYPTQPSGIGTGPSSSSPERAAWRRCHSLA